MPAIAPLQSTYMPLIRESCAARYMAAVMSLRVCASVSLPYMASAIFAGFLRSTISPDKSRVSTDPDFTSDLISPVESMEPIAATMPAINRKIPNSTDIQIAAIEPKNARKNRFIIVIIYI